MENQYSIEKRYFDAYRRGGIIDASVLWLIMDSNLFFHPYARDVVRWLLTDYGIATLSRPSILTFLEEHFHEDISDIKSILEDICISYFSCCTDDFYEISSTVPKNIREQLSRIKRESKQLNKQISNGKKSDCVIEEELKEARRILWRRYFYEVLPKLIFCDNECFLNKISLIQITKSVVKHLDSLALPETIEKYLQDLFSGYRTGLFNRLLTPIGDVESRIENLSNIIALANDNSIQTLYERYFSYRDYKRSHHHEQIVSNQFLYMMVSGTNSNSSTSASAIVRNTLHNHTDLLEEIVCTLDSTLSKYHQNLEDFQKKYGIRIKINIDVSMGSNEESIRYNNGNFKKPSSFVNNIHLPDILNTKRAQIIFGETIKRKWMIITSDGRPEWIGINNSRGKDAQFAYLCGEIYGYKHSDSGNDGASIPSFELGMVFGIKHIYDKLRQVHNKSNKIQPWRKIIDELINDCSDE